nr:tRNA lysidine(34) synthetase TilS [Cellulomonas persica]
MRCAVTDALADLPDDALVLVACSGGPDSLALAAGAAFAVPRSGRRVGAVVVDHGLVPGSAEVAARAAEQCRALGLDPVLVVPVQVTGTGGPEAAARAARYAALEQAADESGAAAVLLGHTLDDQAETVLLGLSRGSGARSLAGMAPVRGRLRRPLLGIRRQDTLAVCAVLGLEPWHDPTNAGQPGDPLRSRVRAHVLPVLERELGPGVAQALARSATQLREDADALDAAAAALLTSAVVTGAPDSRTVDAAATALVVDPRIPGAGRFVAPTPLRRSGATKQSANDEPGDAHGDGDGDGDGDGGAGVVLDVGVLCGAGDAVRRRAVRAAIVAAGAPDGSVHRVHVLAVDALLTDWHGQGPVQLPGRVVARRRCGTLVVGPDSPPTPTRTTRPADQHRT